MLRRCLAKHFSEPTDFSQKFFGLIGGFSAGRGRNDIRGLFEGRASVQSVEFYGGLRLHRGAHEPTLLASHVKIGESKKVSLQFSLRAPLARD